MRLVARRLLGLLLVVLGACGLAFSGPAAAGSGSTTIDDVGWWWRVQQGPPLPPVPAPPTVPGDGIMVSGAPEGATAMGAVRMTLPAGDGAPVLTLQVVPDTAAGLDTALLLACQAGSAWTGGSAQNWESAPSPLCEQSVQGQVADDGTTVTFPLGPLQFGDQINVILVPGADPLQPPGVNGSSFSVAFRRPTSADVETAAGFAPPPPIAPPAGATGFTPPASSGGFVPSTFGGSFTAPALPPIAAALPDDAQGRTATAPVDNPPLPTIPAGDDGPLRSGAARPLAAVLVLLGVLAAAGGWRRDAVATAARDTAEGPIGGLGRFARPRTGNPPELG